MKSRVKTWQVRGIWSQQFEHKLVQKRGRNQVSTPIPNGVLGDMKTDKSDKLVCNVCSMTFSTGGHYEGHIKMWTKVRNRTYANLVLQGVHIGQVYYATAQPVKSAMIQNHLLPTQPHNLTCDTCGQQCTRKYILMDHLARKRQDIT